MRSMAANRALLSLAAIAVVSAVAWPLVRSQYLLSRSEHSQPADVQPVLESNANCGPNALYVACRLAGRSVELDAIRKKCGASPTGTTMLALKQACEACDFTVSAVETDLPNLTSQLVNQPRSAILYFSTGHFATAHWSNSRRSLVLLDPPQVLDLDQVALRKLDWNGYALILTPNPGK